VTVRKKGNGKVGRSPVIAVRVRTPLHKRIIKSAKLTGRSLSEEMAVLLERGFEFTDRFGNPSMALHVQSTKIAVARLDINPGDTVVLKTEQLLTSAQCKELTDRFKAFVPEGVKVVLLSWGLGLDVMKAERQ
jgi:hypothetical protein